MSGAATTKEALEALIAPPGYVRVTQEFVEALISVVARSPSTPTGAGVSLDKIESLILVGSGSVHSSRLVIEAIVVDASTIGDPGTGTVQTVSYGFST